MQSFAKMILLAAVGVGCLACGSGAQQPSTPIVPGPLSPPAVVIKQLAAPVTDPAGKPNVYYATGKPLGEAQFLRTFGFHDAADGATLQLAKQISEAKTDAEKDKLKDKLKETLTKQFDDRQKRHEKEIESLEAQVKKLKEMVTKRQENKKEIIEERTKQLEREVKGLGW